MGTYEHSTNAVLHARRLSIEIGSQKLVTDLCFELSVPGTVAILGRSGCGKTTLLRTLAGLRPPTEGGVELFGSKPEISYGTSSIEFLHQQPCVWPHLTVRQNLEFVYRMQDKLINRERIEEVYEISRLNSARDLYPFQLSGGMLTRVALARAFLARPKLLFADEPFAGLDFLTSSEMSSQLQQLKQLYGGSLVWITHDVSEAVEFADTILIFITKEKGRVVAVENDRHSATNKPGMLNESGIKLRDHLLSWML